MTADPFTGRQFIRGYPTRAQAEAFIEGVKACWVWTPLEIREQADRHSPTGVWFQIWRA